MTHRQQHLVESAMAAAVRAIPKGQTWSKMEDGIHHYSLGLGGLRFFDEYMDETSWMEKATEVFEYNPRLVWLVGTIPEKWDCSSVRKKAGS